MKNGELMIFLMLVSGLCLALVCGLTLNAAQKPRVDASRLAWWREARFGMFIHWGPVSLKGTEIGWSRGAEVPVADYDALYKKFNPTLFDADAWVTIAKQAGMKYVVITSKHHGIFSPARRFRQ